MFRMFEKVAEHRSKVPLLAETSCQNSGGWVFEKTGKWYVGEGRKHPVTERKASFKKLYINQVRVLRKQTRFQNSAVE